MLAPSDSPVGSRPLGAGTAAKFNPYHDDAGRFTTPDGAGGGALTGPGHGLGGEGKPSANNNDNRVRVAQVENDPNGNGRNRDVLIEPNTPIETRIPFARDNAAEVTQRVREFIPNWQGPASISTGTGPLSPEQELANYEATINAGEAQLREIARQGMGGNSGPPLEATPSGSVAGSLLHPGYDATYPLGDKPPDLPDFLTRPIGGGSLTGDVQSLKPAELRFANELRALGNHVEIIPRGKDQTPDFKINGIEHELKTVTNVVRTDADGLSKSISSTIGDARSQSSRVIIDARGQAGMTLEAAGQAVRRAYGADNSQKIMSITILTPQGPLYAPRIP